MVAKQRIRSSVWTRCCLIAICTLQSVNSFFLPASLPAVAQGPRLARQGVLSVTAKKGPTVRPYFEGKGKKTMRKRKVGGMSKEQQQEQARQKAFQAAQEAAAAQLDAVKNAVHLARNEIKPALEKDGFYVCDNFLGKLAANQMLAEAKDLQKAGLLQLGESTRWNEELDKPETYQKENVYTMQVQGGDQYQLAPRLTEYVVQLTASLTASLNAQFPQPVLLETHQTNKLAVCTGDGSHYAKHYDNQGGEDRRKLTALYYMNPNWQEELGGCFRAYKRDSTEEFTDIAPKFDRFFCFWSDELIHSVQPSFATNDDEHRWALTVWLYAGDGVDIKRDPEAEDIHFPNLASPEQLSG